MSGNTLALDEFKLDTLLKNDRGEFINPRIVMIAKSGSGKSWVVRNILYYLRDIPCGTVIAPTDKMTKFYDAFVPSCFVHHKYREQIIPRVLQRQRSMLKQNEERVARGKRPVDPRAFLVMDDCMAEKHLWIKDPNVLEIMNQGRHFQLTYVLTMQYCLGIQPELRTQFDFIFLLGEDNFASRRKLFEHWAGVFPKYEIFEQVFNQVTDNYGCMVINNRIKTIDLRKKVFWYRAKEVPDFSIGSSHFTRFNEDNFDKDYEEKNQVLDLSSLGSKRRTVVNVKMIT